MQKAKNTGMNGHIAKSRDINKLSEILRKIFISVEKTPTSFRW